MRSQLPVSLEVARSPIAERGWFITIAYRDGSVTRGWIGKHGHLHLDRRSPN
ncbi:hypothetical protein [Amycolatopsis sp.]|uniref:hypothetical protein n=1 Tax=Amycolatopsis sp. TaxID=37632 RepID=UPI00262BA8A9|nr:hypothetical protein [Amycolatopsis sp.]